MQIADDLVKVEVGEPVVGNDVAGSVDVAAEMHMATVDFD